MQNCSGTDAKYPIESSETDAKSLRDASFASVPEHFPCLTLHHILLFLVELGTHKGDEFVISLVNRRALFSHLSDFHFATMEVTDTDEVDEGGMATTIESGFPHVVTESFEAGTIHESSATLAEKLSNLYGTLDSIVVGLV